jgi:small subunit ribosomal protein S21
VDQPPAADRGGPSCCHPTEDVMSVKMRLHQHESIGAALRRFKKLVERSGLKRELRARETYEKPCEARRRKEASRRRAMAKGAAANPNR